MMKQILSFLILQCFISEVRQSSDGMHKEDARISPCMFAMYWDNPCRLLYLMPHCFFVYDIAQMETVAVQEGKEALEA